MEQRHKLPEVISSAKGSTVNVSAMQAVPAPLPGKTIPAPDTLIDLIGTDLVAAKGVLRYRAGDKPFSASFIAAKPDGQMVPGRAAFESAGTSSFRAAVEHASRVASQFHIPVGGSFRDAGAQPSRAQAVVQAADGRYYITALNNQGSHTSAP